MKIYLFLTLTLMVLFTCAGRAEGVETVVGPGAIPVTAAEALIVITAGGAATPEVIVGPASLSIRLKPGLAIVGPTDVTVPAGVLVSFNRISSNRMHSLGLDGQNGSGDALAIAVPSGKKLVLFPASIPMALAVDIEKAGNGSQLPSESLNETMEFEGPCTVTIPDGETPTRPQSFDTYVGYAIVDNELMVSPLGQVTQGPGAAIIIVERSDDMSNSGPRGFRQHLRPRESYYRINTGWPTP